MIELAMGGGSGATQALVERCFLKTYGKPEGPMEDSALVPGEDGYDLVFSTDGFVVMPLEFPGGDIGRLAVAGTVNDLLVRGAVPKVLTAAFILEEGLEEETLLRITSSMKRAAEEAGVRLVSGDTKVIERRNREEESGLFITTSGIGMVKRGEDLGIHRLRPGQKLIVSGTLGDHQAAIYSARMGIENDIVSDVGPLTGMMLPILKRFSSIRTMRDLTRGGLITCLNEWAEESGLRMELQEGKIPVSRPVQGLTRILGLDPLSMANEGKLLIAVESEDAENILQALRETKEGAHASIVGEVVSPGEGKKSGSFLMTRSGVFRRLRTPWAEGLPRIC